MCFPKPAETCSSIYKRWQAWKEPEQEEEEQEEGRPLQVVKSRFQFLEGLTESQGQRTHWWTDRWCQIIHVSSFVYLSICLSIHPSIYPSFLSTDLSVCQSIHLCVFPSICLAFYLSRQQSIHHPICPSFSLLLSFKICPFPCLSICLSSCGLSIYLAVYLLTHLGTEAFHPSI